MWLLEESSVLNLFLIEASTFDIMPLRYHTSCPAFQALYLPFICFYITLWPPDFVFYRSIQYENTGLKSSSIEPMRYFISYSHSHNHITVWIVCKVAQKATFKISTRSFCATLEIYQEASVILNNANVPKSIQKSKEHKKQRYHNVNTDEHNIITKQVSKNFTEFKNIPIPLRVVSNKLFIISSPPL